MKVGARARGEVKSINRPRAAQARMRLIRIYLDAMKRVIYEMKRVIYAMKRVEKTCTLGLDVG